MDEAHGLSGDPGAPSVAGYPFCALDSGPMDRPRIEALHARPLA